MAKRKPPEPNPTHWTLKPAGSKDYKGTYFRRLDDIRKGLLEIDKSKMPAGGRFLFLYYGCEKLGKGIVGIHKTRAADEAYDQHLHLSELGRMGLAIPDAELDALFVGDDKTTARYWLNEIARRGEECRPLLHDAAALFEQVATRISRLGRSRGSTPNA